MEFHQDPMMLTFRTLLYIPQTNLMTILRDADIWQLETREKPTHDEEGEQRKNTGQGRAG